MSSLAESAPPGVAAVIELSGISKSFGAVPRIDALRDVNLRIQPGDFLAVTGPSGSGKSTLLNILGLLDRPTIGSYQLEGVQTDMLSETDRSAVRGRRIGFVFQSFQLLEHRSAIENVVLGQLYARSDRRLRLVRAEQALDRVGLANRMYAMPATMSGGERQRVAIARAIINEPALLLCDEPTGNLDSVTAARVLDVLGELNRTGSTIVMITHDPVTASRAAHQVAILDGQLHGSTDRPTRSLTT